jgi:hypothetical protein
VSRSSVFRRHFGAPHPEIVRGDVVYLYDREGHRYIDAPVTTARGIAQARPEAWTVLTL